MGTILKINKLYFSALYKGQIIICASVLLLHILISVAIMRLAITPGPAGVGDFIAMVWMLIIGLIFFSPGFKYLISQGFSRKTFFVSGGVSIIFLAFIMAVMVMVFYLINLKVSNVWVLYELVYHNRNILGTLVWEFAVLLFLGAAGWFIRLVYYVSDSKTKIMVSVIPFVLASLLILFNALVDGKIGRGIWEFFKTVMGLSGSSPNPYIGALSMLAASVIIGGFIFLLLRRARVND